MTLPTPISADVFTAFVKCKHKGHLKLTGVTSEKGDYEKLQLRLAEEHRRKAVASILAANGGPGSVERPPSLLDAIRHGPAVIVEAGAAAGSLSCRLDALEKVGDTTSGKSLYAPVLFVHDEKVTREDKLLLAFQGVVLASVQGMEPTRGKIIHGNQLASSRVHLGPLLEEAQSLIREIEEVRDKGTVPQMVLNRHCPACEFRKRCREVAIARDDLSLLGGLSAKEITKLNGKGIFSVAQYSHTFRPRKARKSKPAGAATPKVPLSLQALAIREGTVYVAEKPILPAASVHPYLDVEGLPDRDFHYLIGLVVREGDTRREFSFWADGPQEEPYIWSSFLEVVGSLGDFVMFHYGSYESDFLKKMGRLYGGDPDLLKKIEARSVNVLSLVYSRVFFPVHANDLKSVASFLGFRWSVEDASGLKSIVWRYDWEATGDDRLKQQLLTYNREDCLALERMVAMLSAVASDAWDDAGGTAPRIAAMEDIKQGSRGNFGKKQFFFPELARITKCSYFDYQRKRILFRTNPLLKRYARPKAGGRKKKCRVNKTVECSMPQRCPQCQAESLKVGHRYARLVLDLKLFRGGVKRWVTRYTTRSYKCQACGHPFLPEDYRAISATKYGHSLCAWAVHATISLRQTNENVVENLADLFGYSISRGKVSEFRKRLAEYYRPTYLAILEKLKNGPLVHADETKASMRPARGNRRDPADAKVGVRGRSTNGFVWAFANPESVVYVFTPTRDGKIVRENLAGFKGVLVSDFYTAYDSLDCPQQKCLIHLVRDFNDDLFSHPFDEELKRLARDFTVLLQAVVETIDRFGLKRLHLAKHQKEVDRFFSRLSQATYRSEVAAYYQQRLTKYKDKLFTFLSHDGIPWNNNNGENAIKRFAALRKVLGTAFTEDGIKDYMVLLSLAQTLRYRGGSFWRFLLSRETDLDAFLARRRRGS
jgi:predicted RecB family nuclease